MSNATETVSVAQAAAAAHRSTRTIWRRISDGTLPAIDRPGPDGNRTYIPVHALEAWLAGKPRKATSEATTPSLPAIIELAITLDTDGTTITAAVLTGYAPSGGCPRTVVELTPAADVTATTVHGRHVANATWGVELDEPLGHADLPLTGGGRRLTCIWALPVPVPA